MSIIRVYLYTDKTPHQVVYQGSHPTIPRIGDHICVEYLSHRVFRVEHVFNCDWHADVWLEEKPS